MRTLQRLRHVQSPRTQDLPRLRRAEERLRDVKEGRVKRRWLRRSFWTVFFVAMALAGRWLWGLRLVADGLVRANMHVVVAPAQVRVAELACSPGMEVREGDPLVRLEPLTGQEERRALAMVVEQYRLRLDLVESGGSLEGTDLARRSELIEEADREAIKARSDLLAAQARVRSLEQRRELVAVEMAQAVRNREGQLAMLNEQSESLRAKIGQAEAQKDKLAIDADRERALLSAGAVSESAKEWAETNWDRAMFEMHGLAADSRAAERTRATARDLLGLERERGPLALDSLDAEVEAARREAEAIRVREQLWSRLSERRRDLFPFDEAGLDQLSELERELLKAELAEAEARLASAEEAAGGVILYAQFDGVVDRVFVQENGVAEPGAAILTCFDPSSQWVVAFAPPQMIERLRAGQGCRIRPEGMEQKVEGQVHAFGAEWVPCPPELPLRTHGYTDLRRPIRIECSDPEVAGLLQPNMRVKVMFGRKLRPGSLL